MTKWMLGVLATTLYSISLPLAAAGDYDNGKRLHKNCFGCHNESIYTRPDRIIHSYPDLKNRVKFCETNNGLDWTQREIEDVATYLNKDFYRFGD